MPHRLRIGNGKSVGGTACAWMTLWFVAVRAGRPGLPQSPRPPIACLPIPTNRAASRKLQAPLSHRLSHQVGGARPRYAQHEPAGHGPPGGATGRRGAAAPVPDPCPPGYLHGLTDRAQSVAPTALTPARGRNVTAHHRTPGR